MKVKQPSSGKIAVPASIGEKISTILDDVGQREEMCQLVSRVPRSLMDEVRLTLAKRGKYSKGIISQLIEGCLLAWVEHEKEKGM